MSAIIPYVGNALGRSFTNPYIRQQAFSVAGQITRAAMKHAARRIQSAWRRRRASRARSGYRNAKRRKTMATKKANIGKRARVKFADPVGSSNCKRTTVTDQELVLRASRTLYSSRLDNITFGDGINNRERSVVNVRGIKIWHQFINQVSDGAVYLNLAIVSIKQGCPGDTLPNEDFFRDYGANRTKDFNIAESSLELFLGQINTDLYLVHWHKRYYLNNTDSTPNNQGRYARIIRKYIKLNRQLRFDGTNTNPVNGNLYACWWVDKEEATNGSPIVLDVVKHGSKAILYFKETGTF